MKRLPIIIELIRRCVRERLSLLPPLWEDPLWEFAGASDAEPVDDIDEFLYGWSAKT